MAKTESTAVNELIDLVQSGQQPVKDPDDLMFAPPRPAVVAAAKDRTPRMTATVPPLRAAGEVAPLPRQRAPQGTQTLPSMPPAVRVSTAPPARAVSIPPLGGPPLGGETMRSIAPPPPPASARTSRPSLPPPLRKTTVGHAAEGTPAPERLPSLPSLLKAPSPNASAGAAFEAPMTLDPAESNPLMQIPVPAARERVLPIDMTSNAPWFEEPAPAARGEDENWVGTAVVQKQVYIKPLLGKLVMPMALLVIAGVFIGGYFAFDGEGGKPHVVAAAGKQDAKPSAAPAALAATDATPIAAAEPTKSAAAPAAAPAAAEPAPAAAAAEPAQPAPAAAKPEVAAAIAAAEPAKPAPAVTTPVTPPNLVTAEPGHAAPAIAKPATLVDVRIDSTPSGATVMLVDRGKTSFLGTTPVSAAVDPSRQYDLVFTYESKPTQIEHLDPNKTKRLAIVLGKHAGAVSSASRHVETPAAKRDTAKLESARPEPSEKPKAKLVEPSFDTTPTAPAAKKVAAAPSGDGTLMISSKPPCEIYVDGKATGLTTPQRSISLAAGTHKITLVNSEKSIKKTVAVQISAGKTEKVIQDLMK